MYLLFSLVAVCFHFTAFLFVLSSFLLYKFSAEKVFIIFAFSGIIYALDIMEPLVNKSLLLGNIDFINYYLCFLKKESNSRAGVRLDFLIFTMFWGLFAFYNYKSKKNEFSLILLFSYLALSMPFMVLGFIPYSDRLLLPAWSLIPLILASFLILKFKISKSFFNILYISLPFWSLLALYFYGIIL
jgi:hypothetical protein